MPVLKHSPLHRACVVLAVAALGTFSALASAQTFPTRPITVVVPIAPGGSTDLITRLVAKHMSESLGQPVVTHVPPARQRGLKYTDDFVRSEVTNWSKLAKAANLVKQ